MWSSIIKTNAFAVCFTELLIWRNVSNFLISNWQRLGSSLIETKNRYFFLCLSVVESLSGEKRPFLMRANRSDTTMNVDFLTDQFMKWQFSQFCLCCARNRSVFISQFSIDDDDCDGHSTTKCTLFCPLCHTQVSPICRSKIKSHANYDVIREHRANQRE